MDTQKLVKECIREIPAAQRQLYDHFAESMLGVCYRYTKSMDDAEDVLQDGFVKVFKNLGQYKYEGELGGMDQENNGDNGPEFPEKEFPL